MDAVTPALVASSAGVFDSNELCDVFLKLVESPHYRTYKTREGMMRLDAWPLSSQEELPWRLRFLTGILQTMCVLAQKEAPGLRIVPSQVILCCVPNGRRPELRRKGYHMATLCIHNSNCYEGTLEFSGPPPPDQGGPGMPLPVNMASPRVQAPTVSINLYYQLMPPLGPVTCSPPAFKRPRSPCEIDPTEPYGKRVCRRW